MDWHDAVKAAITRLTARARKRTFTRQALIIEEMERIVSDTRSRSQRPEQTLSRVLQELRDENFIYFLERGEYLLTDSPVAVEQEELSEADIDGLIESDLLAIDTVETADEQALQRRRIGQKRLRKLSLDNYGHRCALCDVQHDQLLVAAHIARWSDNPEARGRLSNVICLCRFHDPLFEMGYISLADDYTVLKKPGGGSRTIQVNLDTAERFRLPHRHPPAPEYLREHRRRSGFCV